MAHIVFLRTAAADLTAGKPPLKGVPTSAPLSAAAAAIQESQEAAVAVWRDGASPLAPAAATVVGLLSSLDVVAFLAAHVGAPGAAIRTPSGDVVADEPALVREVEPHGRLIEIVELMKQGALRVLVRKNITKASTVDKKQFAPFFNAVLKITGKPRASAREQQAFSCKSTPPTPSTFGCDRYCCLTREDIVRFLINCLGALPQVPMRTLSSLGAVNRCYAAVEASSPASEAAWRLESPRRTPRRGRRADATRRGASDPGGRVPPQAVAARAITWPPPTPWRSCRRSAFRPASMGTGRRLRWRMRGLRPPRRRRGSVAGGSSSRGALQVR